MIKHFFCPNLYVFKYENLQLKHFSSYKQEIVFLIFSFRDFKGYRPKDADSAMEFIKVDRLKLRK